MNHSNTFGAESDSEGTTFVEWIVRPSQVTTTLCTLQTPAVVHKDEAAVSQKQAFELSPPLSSIHPRDSALPIPGTSPTTPAIDTGVISLLP